MARWWRGRDAAERRTMRILLVVGACFLAAMVLVGLAAPHLGYSPAISSFVLVLWTPTMVCILAYRFRHTVDEMHRSSWIGRRDATPRAPRRERPASD